MASINKINGYDIRDSRVDNLSGQFYGIDNQTILASASLEGKYDSFQTITYVCTQDCWVCGWLSDFGSMKINDITFGNTRVEHSETSIAAAKAGDIVTITGYCPKGGYTIYGIK